jgi:hypothetical protein
MRVVRASSLLVRAGVLGLVCVMTSCGGGKDKPRDGGAGGTDASNHDAADSGQTPSACVAVADHAISEEAGRSGRPALAWTSDGYRVVWPDDRSGVLQIYLAQLDRGGLKIGADQPVTAAADADFPALAWSGQILGMAFVTESTTPPMVHFARLATDGALQGSVADVGQGTEHPSIVWDGQTFALAYHSARGAAMPEIFMSHFDASGARVGTELQLTNAGLQSVNPSIAWTGSRYGISFQDSRTPTTEIFLGLVDANGAEIGQEAQVSSSNGAGTSYIAASSTGFAITYAGLTGPTLTRLDTAGIRTAADVPIKLTPAPIVWNGARYAFASSGTAGGEVFLQTIDEAAAAPSTAVRVSAPGSGTRPDEIALVWNGSGYGVTWTDNMSGGAPETHFAVVCP